jgi:TolB-like protein
VNTKTKGGEMKKLRMKLLVISVICLMPGFMNAKKIGVLHFKATGVSSATAQIVTDLLSSELVNYGYTVSSPDAMDAVVGDVIKCYEPVCAAEAGFTSKVEQVVYGSVSKLGEKHIVQASVVNVSTQEVIWSGSLSAATAEDLDMVAQRIAKSIAEGKKTGETVEVGTVTEEEEEEPLRRRVFYTTGIKAGALQPLGGYGESGTMFHLGALFWYETPNVVAELAFYTAFSGNLGDVEGTATEAVAPELSILYMFTKQDISPYIGGGVGFGILSLSPDTGFIPETAYGVAINGGGGLVFFRTYDIRVLLDVRYRVNLSQVENFDGPHQSIMFSIGFTYRPKFKFCGGCGGGCL